MSKTYIPVAVRRMVIQRAANTCEYCRIPSLFSNAKSYHIDHVISEKHGGGTTAENLALACPACNITKGSDIASLLPGNPQVIALFNPRIDYWYEHFRLAANGEIVALTDNGQVTIDFLKLNDEENNFLRQVLLAGEIDILPKRRVI